MKHKYHEGWNFCPLCNAPLRWHYDGDEWTPCDREPILVKRDLDGKLTCVIDRELKDYCMEYHPGDSGTYKLALLPHVYSCGELNGWYGKKVERT